MSVQDAVDVWGQGRTQGMKGMVGCDGTQSGWAGHGDMLDNGGHNGARGLYHIFKYPIAAQGHMDFPWYCFCNLICITLSLS